MISSDELELGVSMPEGTTLLHGGMRSTEAIWLAMFGGAADRIHLHQMYLASDRGVVGALERALLTAVDRGVDVRLLVDDTFFAKNSLVGASEYLHPFSHLHANGVRTRRWKGRRNGILHSKLFVVDGEAWLGSPNFDWRSLTQICELGVRIRNSKLVDAVHRIFQYDWETAEADTAYPEIPELGGWTDTWHRGHRHRAKVVWSPTGDGPSPIDFESNAIYGMIENARRTIEIQSRHYSNMRRNGEPWLLIDDALRRAVGRGVRVRLMVDEGSLERREYRDALLYLGGLGVEIRIVKIPKTSLEDAKYSRMLHSKSLVVDSAIVWLGTGNLSPDDLVASRNVGLIVDGPTFSADVSAVYETIWHSAYAAGSTS